MTSRVTSGVRIVFAGAALCLGCAGASIPSTANVVAQYEAATARGDARGDQRRHERKQTGAHSLHGASFTRFEPVWQ